MSGAGFVQSFKSNSEIAGCISSMEPAERYCRIGAIPPSQADIPAIGRMDSLFQSGGAVGERSGTWYFPSS